MKSFFLKRIKSFTAAFNGIGILIKNEAHARIHALATLLVIVLGGLFCISLSEWIAVVLCIGLVFSLEAFNSAVEKLCDKVDPNFNETIGKVKDLAAAGVLIAAIISIIVACIIFIPKISKFLCFIS